MKTAKDFLIENQGTFRRRLYSESTVIKLMNDFADYATDQPEETQDVAKLLVAFCWELKRRGVALHKDYTQEDYERIAYAFLVEDEGTEDNMRDDDEDGYELEDDEPDFLNFNCTCGAWVWSNHSHKFVHVSDCCCDSNEPFS